MKEAMFWIKKEDFVNCQLCPKRCVLKEGGIGQCGVRQNIMGVLYSFIYGKACSVALDPIEKKPLYHFMPGSMTYSIGSFGCNLKCKFCQNWRISQKFKIIKKMITPEDVIFGARSHGCNVIAYTYNEPTMMYEFVYDCAKLARSKGFKNIIVTNGYINEEPLRKLYGFIDAANVDLKAFNEKFYREMTNSSLSHVLKSLKLMRELGIHIEVTNLIIPGYNDNFDEIEEMCKWLKKNIGDVPLHFSRYFPMYKLKAKVTPIETLRKAEKIAKKYLSKVHVGNV